MRLGVVLPWPVRSGGSARGHGSAGPADMVRVAVAAEEAGLDLVWVTSPAPDGGREAGGAPLAVAAALAPSTTAVLVGATVAVGDAHPIVVAEEIAVADQLLGGRLVVALRAADVDGPDGTDRYLEAVELILSSLAPRPFRHEGRVWQVPASLPENVFGVERAVRVTPSTFQMEPTLWFTGAGGSEAAGRFAGSWLAGAGDAPEAAADVWGGLERRLGGATRRLRRPALRQAPPDLDEGTGEALAAGLRAEAATWGLDVAVLDPGTGHPAEHLASWTAMLGSVVRPRLQLDALPPGLEDHWRRHRHDLAGSLRP